MIYENTEIINCSVIGLARRRIIDVDEIKRMQIRAVVDNGSYMLAINEQIQSCLQLPVVEKRKAHMADETISEWDLVMSVEIKF